MAQGEKKKGRVGKLHFGKSRRHPKWHADTITMTDLLCRVHANLRKEAFQANMYSSKNQNQPISFAALIQSSKVGAHFNHPVPDLSKPLCFH